MFPNTHVTRKEVGEFSNLDFLNTSTSLPLPHFFLSFSLLDSSGTPKDGEIQPKMDSSLPKPVCLSSQNQR